MAMQQMIISRGRHRLIGRVAQVALGFQALAVFAMPLALCCCLAMAAAGAAHEVTPSGQHASDGESAANACPHHDLTGATTGDSPSDAGCQNLDRLVVALAGLIGVTDQPPELTPTLAPLAAVPSLRVNADDAVFPVDSPPPRA